MVDRSKELNTLNGALGYLRGLHEVIEMIHEDRESELPAGAPQPAWKIELAAALDKKRENAVTCLLGLVEEKITEAECSAYALQFGKYCTDDPRHRIAVAS